MKKAVITLLILTLLFSACSGNGQSSDNDSSNTSESSDNNSNANDSSANDTSSNNETSDNETESEPEAIQQFTIRGNLFYDENNSGSLDSGESGISDVNIMINNDTVTTDSDGIYQYMSTDMDITITVDQSTLPANYTTTTNNEEQTMTLTTDNEEAVPVGYIDMTATQGYNFEDVFDADNSYDNYYTELIMVSGGMTYNTKMWVSGNSMKFETDTTITCMNGANSYNYIKAENMAVVAPVEDNEQIPTPFTTTDEIDEESFSEIYFVRMDDLDGKEVYVFEHNAPGFKATYFVWKEEGIILKMELEDGTGVYFKDLQFGIVSEEDFALPEGAEVIDMNSMLENMPSP